MDVEAHTKAWLSLQVAAISREADAISRFDFVDPSGALLPAFTAGSHIQIRLRNGVIRSYSLCNNPKERHRYVVAVQRESKGRGGSMFMHDELIVGDSIIVSHPRNQFPLATDDVDNHLLIAGGIGVTPMISMVHELESRREEWSMHYCTRSPERTAFRSVLFPYIESRKVTMHHDYGNPANGLDLPALLREPQAGTHVYCCGPSPFMEVAKSALAAWPQNAVHFEFFSSSGTALNEESNSDFYIKLASSGKLYEVPVGKNILSVLRENGIVVDSDCEDGYCGTCITRYFSGCVEHRDTVLSEDERRNYMMLCCSRAAGTVELDL